MKTDRFWVNRANNLRTGVVRLAFVGALVLAMCTSGHALAGTISGKIASVIQRSSDGLTYVVIDGTPSGKPACASNTYWMIADENSEAGKKQFAMLLTAWAGGLEVKIVGRNSCLRWGDGEDINSIQTL